MRTEELIYDHAMMAIQCADRTVSSPPSCIHSQVAPASSRAASSIYFLLPPAMRSLNIHEPAFDIHITEATATHALLPFQTWQERIVQERRALVAAAALRLMPQE